MAQIHDATDQGDVAQIKRLLAAGADVNTIAEDGWPPLNIAALQGHTAAAECLIEHGADVNATSPGEFRPLFNAAQGGYLAIVKLLVANGAAVDARSNDGATALYNAATNGHAGVVELLISAGAEVDAQANNQGTPLGTAAEQGHLDVVRLLVAKGADLEAANSDGFTPLHMAAQEGHRDVASFMLDHGANVDVRNHAGSTPDDIAHLHGHPDLVELIAGRGVRKPEGGTYCSKCGRGVIMSWTCPKCGKLFCDTCSGMTTTKPEIHQGFTVQNLGERTPTCPYCETAGLPAIDDEVLGLMRQDKKIAAIKLHMKRTGKGLKEAKDAIEELWPSRFHQATATTGGRQAPGAGPVDESEIVALVGQGEKIAAIKLYMKRTGTGLKEAKDAVEELWASCSHQATATTTGGRQAEGTGPVDESEIVSLLRGRGRPGHVEAVRLWRERTGQGLKESINAVNSIARANGLPVEDSGCFIATACYGDVESSDVRTLRHFRDEVLLSHALGRAVISLYYSVSPPIAEWLKAKPMFASLVRRLFLTPLAVLVRTMYKTELNRADARDDDNRAATFRLKGNIA